MAMFSQFLGFMLDAYDMAMVIVMAPILVKIFVSPKGSQLGNTWRWCWDIPSPWPPVRWDRPSSALMPTRSAAASC